MMLADACEVFADGDWVESKDQSPDGIRLIQTGNVGAGVIQVPRQESSLYFGIDIQATAMHGDYRGRLPHFTPA